MACEMNNLPVCQKEQPIVPLSLKPESIVKGSAAITIRMPVASIDIHNGASRETIEAVLTALKIIC
jgi:hypothetical protein